MTDDGNKTGAFRRLDKIVQAALIERWQLSVTRISSLGGRNALNWRIDNPGGSYVAKLIRPGDSDLDQLITGLKVAAAIAAPDLPVPAAVPNSHGSWIDELPEGSLVVLRWIPGGPLCANKVADVEAVGTTIALMHDRLAQLDPPQGVPSWPWSWLSLEALGPEDSGDIALVRSAVETAREAAPTVGLLHGDPTIANFIDANGVTAVLDWGSVLAGPILYDLAVAQLDLTRAGSDPSAVTALERAYLARRPDAAADWQHLPILRRLRCAAEIVYFTSRLRLTARTPAHYAAAVAGLDRARTSLKTTPSLDAEPE